MSRTADGAQKPLGPYSTNRDISVLPYQSFDVEQRQFLARAGLDEIAKLEAWTVVGSNSAINYSTHGIFRYFGKFPAPIAHKLITDNTKPGNLIVDPACGSGTTGVEALLSGRRAALFDVNPLSVLISRVKTQALAFDELVASIARVEKKFRTLKSGNFLPDDLDVEHWFLPETAAGLSKLLRCIDLEESESIRSFLTLVFASIVRRVSKATTQQGRLFLDVDSALPDVIQPFLKAATKAAQSVSELPNVSLVDAMVGNVLAAQPSESISADLVIFHPPYFNAYKFTSVNTLEMAWLGFNRKEVRSREIREYFKVGKPENAENYIDDLVTSLGNIREFLPKGGRLCMMNGDALMGGEHIQISAPSLARVSDFFDTESIAMRVPKFTEATWASSQRRARGKLGVTMNDFVVTLKAK